MDIKHLKNAVQEAVRYLKSQSDVDEAFVYASKNSRTVARVAYTTHVPCEGVLEPKTGMDLGISIYVVFRNGEGIKLVGFGHENSDISLQAVRNALEKARTNSSHDPYFHSLPSPEHRGKLKPTTPRNYHDAGFLKLTIEEETTFMAQAGWDAINGALARLQRWCRKENVSPEAVEFILSGDVFLLREQMALASTTGIAETDETTLFSSFLTAMVEHGDSKGSAIEVCTHLWDFRPFQAGYRAADNAIKGVNGTRVPSGEYNVIFGPQAVVDLFGLLATSLYLDFVEAGGGIFMGKYGKQIASPLLSVYDDGSLRGGAGTKRITDEGYPTRRIDLIEDGVLVGFITSDYISKRVLYTSDIRETTDRLGIDPRTIRHLLIPAANGFRSGYGGGRISWVMPGSFSTNIVIESAQDLKQDDLLKKVGNGLFIGRLWYTYPTGGFSTGDFSSTVVADSFLIINGELSTPLAPNSLRVNDNLTRILQAIIGITKHRVPTFEWFSDEIVHAPWIGVSDVNVIEIGNGKSKKI